ncbi:MAG: sugar isomerase [Caldilinea sp. CFX5]|nr:sugar isomerase [Caldilinea sp. CFX5]
MLETQSAKPTPLLPLGSRLLQRLPAQQLLTGSGLFFLSTLLVNAGNYCFNLLLGRLLGPARFADVSLIITLFLFLTFITAGFQQTATKFAAIHSAKGDDAQLWALRRWLNRRSWLIGLLLGLLVGGLAPFWQGFFHTTSPWIFVIFAVGLPFYFVQGIDRGLLQGQMRFGLLAASYQAEMWVRLLVGLGLVLIGWAAYGAVLALTLSIMATWAVAAYGLRRNERAAFADATLKATERQALLAFALPVLLVEVSLILINNSDVLLVKRFFDSASAGQYAALALIGRIVFFGTWSVVITMFPLVAQKAQQGEPHRHLLWLSLGMVAGVSLVIVTATAVAPALILQLLFGAAYLPVAPLLWLYALATALFALANVLINYHLALGNRGGAFLALTAGLCQVALLWLFHATLTQVVMIQVGLMGLLLLLLFVWDQYQLKAKGD